MGMAVHERTDGLATKRAPTTTTETIADDVRSDVRSNLMAARYLNLTVAAIGVLITLPLLVLIAIVVKCTSRGPVLYTQTRVGLDNRRRNGNGNGSQLRKSDIGVKPFKIYKFRT